MATDPCNPLAEPQLPPEGTPHHHAVHHAVGRIRHRIHHSLARAPQHAPPVSDACGKPEAALGHPGTLPAAPAGRVPGAALLPGAAAPKAALLGSGAKLGMAMLGLAGAAGVAGAGAFLLPPGKPAATSGFTQPSPSGLSPSGGEGTTLSPPPASGAPPHGATPGTPIATAVPEPSSAAVFALAVAAALVARWRFARPVRASSRQP